MNKFSSVWVFSDTPSRLPELMNGAQALGENVNTFVLSDEDSAAAFHLGADHVWLLSGKPEDRMVEDYADAMAETIRQHSEGGAVLSLRTDSGGVFECRAPGNLESRQAWWAKREVLARGTAIVHFRGRDERGLPSNPLVVSVKKGTT